MAKLSAKQKLLNFLSKNEGYNSFSVGQARSMFRIKNVAARIAELRQEGHCIYTNTRTRGDGSKVSIYRLGKPSKALVRAAVQAGYNFNA